MADPTPPPSSKRPSDHGLPEPHPPDAVRGKSIDLSGPPGSPPLPSVDLARPPAQRPADPSRKTFDPRVLIPMDLLDPHVQPKSEVQAQRKAALARKIRIALGILAGVVGGGAIGAGAILFVQWRNAPHHQIEEIGVSFAVTSEPPGAAILIDGKPTNLVTPTQLKEWDFSMPHEVTVALKDFYPERRSVPVGLHPPDLDIKLARLARFTVDSQPPGATILLGEEEVGVTPLAFDVPAERDLDLTVRLVGYLPVSGHVRLQPAENASRIITLHAMATLAVDTDPAGATVTVDGQKTATTPAELELEAGVPHHLEISVPGLPTQTKTVTLKDRQRSEMKIHLEDPRDRKANAELSRVRARLAVARRKLDAVTEKGSSSEFFDTVHRLHNENQLNDEIERLEDREQELTDEIAAHLMELEDRIKGNP